MFIYAIIMIKNILFDFGGVMINVSKWPVKYIEAKNSLKAWFIYDRIKYVIVDYAKWFIDTFGFRKWLIKELGKDLWEQLFERWGHRENAFINSEIVQLVQRLKDIWYKCYLLSDTNEIHASANEIRHIYDIFHDKILSYEIGICKREDTWNNTNKFFDYAIGKLNILPEECIFIDDLQENCELANRVGIKTILAKNPKQIISDLSGILWIDL